MRLQIPLFIGVIATISGLALADAPVAASAVSAEARSCLGMGATIVGSSDVIEGTEGADVVITNGAGVVTTLGGNDLVCITGHTPSGTGVFDTGSGDDRIDASAVNPKQFQVGVLLGPGADELIGGPASELVNAADETLGDTDRDVIDTAGGRDEVSSGSQLSSNLVTQDVISLGAQADSLWLYSPGATLVGGTGRDKVTFALDSPRGASWMIDNRRQRASADGVVIASWSSFAIFTFLGPVVRGPFTFRGSGTRERLVVITPHRWRLDVRMGGGDDRLIAGRGAPDSLYDGGKGSDVLEHFSKSATLLGREGNDVLRGGNDNDILIGGPGNDVARGAGGTDTCRAELRLNCEH